MEPERSVLASDFEESPDDLAMNLQTPNVVPGAPDVDAEDMQVVTVERSLGGADADAVEESRRRENACRCRF